MTLRVFVLSVVSIFRSMVAPTTESIMPVLPLSNLRLASMKERRLEIEMRGEECNHKQRWRFDDGSEFCKICGKQLLKGLAEK